MKSKCHKIHPNEISKCNNFLRSSCQLTSWERGSRRCGRSVSSRRTISRACSASRTARQSPQSRPESAVSHRSTYPHSRRGDHRTRRFTETIRVRRVRQRPARDRAQHPTAKLYAQTLPREAWAGSGTQLDLSMIKNLVAVHRLREVSCLYGFTRFEAAPTSADGEFEDVQLAVRGAPISRDADWLPAIEQFGEGIFIHFDEAAIAEWLNKTPSRQAVWRVRILGQKACRQAAQISGNAVCAAAQPLTCTDVGDRARWCRRWQWTAVRSLRLHHLE